MELTPGSTVHGFAIDACEDLPEIEGTAITGRHEQSGARLLYLRNDDNNKSFAIGFRTPPQDDTGVFHILEHSVLCGSRRFPVKEPFVDLLKSSMQTFLNAMTFPDKTLYPVASTNDQDLQNLMDVYLDAVFHPQIYTKRAIFEQEGWHYELTANDGQANPADLDANDTTLIYNGVVYNEMKGSLSNATSVLYDELQAALFPDTCYAYESGGTPQAIPTLTYENYLDEHRRHYRTDNSYIILYGNLDIERTLAFLDERYLVPVAEEQRETDRQRAEAGLEPLRPRSIDRQAAVQPAHLRRTMDTAAENACTACGYVIGDSSDRVRSMAVEILLDALLGSNESPLKRALLDAGVGHDVNATVSDSLLQPFAMVQVQMPAENAGERLRQIISEKVNELLDRGLDKSLVEAALSHTEFELREHDMGAADGVINSMVALSSWLYDDDAATDYLRYESAFAELRGALEGDYFENLCRTLFCDNDHTASVEIVPAPGVPDDDTAERLATMNASLARDERQRIVEEEAMLRQLQEAPDSPEAVATLPRLSVDDIGAMPEQPRYALDDQAPVPCIRHFVPTRGIAYAYRYFDANCVTFDDLPYLSILSLVLGKLDTAHHTAAEIDTLEQGKLGNLAFYTGIFEQRDTDELMPKFVVSSSALSENCAWLAQLPREIMLETDFSNTDKILDVLKQRKIVMEQMFIASGHTCATARTRSYYARSGVMREQLDNVGFYRFLCDLIDGYDQRAQEVAARLKSIADRVFCDNGCIVSFAGSDEDYAAFWQAGPECDRTNDGVTRLAVPDPVVRNEAFVVPSDVCYAALGWDWRLLDRAGFDGSWVVAARALSYDYLWNEVRVKGGAYGVGFQAMWAGNMRFYSYRDPHLDETVKRFEGASSWLSGFDPSKDQMDGFVVATVAGIDAPVKPRALIKRQAGDFFRGRSPESRRETRDQVIGTDVEAIRALADVIARVVENRALCVFGSKQILESSNEQLDLITLIG